MNIAKSEKIVVLGLMTELPWAGVIWQTIHYLIGLQRLGYAVYYVEAHGHGGKDWIRGEDDDPAPRAAAFIAEIMTRFDLGDRWAYDTRYAFGRLSRRVFGMTELELETLYEQAALIINLSAGTLPHSEHTAKDRLVYLETDPVEVQVELCAGDKRTENFLDCHFIHFSFGENLGNPDCRLPASPRFNFRPTRQPVVMDFWAGHGSGDGSAFTTIGNWSQPYRKLRFQGEVYYWSKHFEFLKFIDLPSRTSQPLELALSSCQPADREMLEAKGWRVRDALGLSGCSDFEAYRSYITASRGEFTVAKDQNIRLRSGWFSDRAATYLAAGRPVINQETGFSNILPTGEGLFAFSTMDEILEAIESVNADYARHRRAATEIARAYFSHEVVLTKLMSEIGAARLQPRPAQRPDAPSPSFTPDLLLSPTSRWPTRLPDATVEAVMSWPVPSAGKRGEPTALSIIIVVFNGLVYTRMCLSSLLMNVPGERCEVIVVDNASTDGTAEYLRQVAEANPQVRVISNDTNLGYAAANNQGLRLARGRFLLLLNNDTIIPDRKSLHFMRALQDPSVGLASPVTNRTCNEAQIHTSYRTHGELCHFARGLAADQAGKMTDLDMLAFYCVGMRREVYEEIGPLDERFGIGMFEDNDYSMRVRQARYRTVCVENAFVHHFGQGTVGELCATGEYDALLNRNRRLFEEKWGIQWVPPKKRITPEYEQLRARIQTVAAERVPANATILVVSMGDEELLRLDGRRAWHFPQREDGSYPYMYPANSDEAIRHVKALRTRGATHLLLPAPGFWWRDYYAEFGEYLGTPVVADEGCLIFSLDHE